MPYRSWNQFTEAHPRAIFIGVPVPKEFPKGAFFDREGRSVPSPLGLFKEWAKDALKGDWSTKAVKNGFLIKVIDQSDLATIVSVFKARKRDILPPGASASYQSDGFCERLGRTAEELGYRTPFKK